MSNENRKKVVVSMEKNFKKVKLSHTRHAMTRGR
jgi:hypothetical protein